MKSRSEELQLQLLAEVPFFLANKALMQIIYPQKANSFINLDSSKNKWEDHAPVFEGTLKSRYILNHLRLPTTLLNSSASLSASPGRELPREGSRDPGCCRTSACSPLSSAERGCARPLEFWFSGERQERQHVLIVSCIH